MVNELMGILLAAGMTVLLVSHWTQTRIAWRHRWYSPEAHELAKGLLALVLLETAVVAIVVWVVYLS